MDSATDGNIPYQGINFSASGHVEKLIPKFKLNYYIVQFIISSLKFAIKNKFDYGYKFNRIKKQTFKLSVNKNNKPDYEYMEQYIINFELNFLTKYLNYLSLN